MINKNYLYYTYMHRKAFVFTVNKIVKNPIDKQALLMRSRFHDLDKALLYTLIPKEIAVEYHIQHATHHMENTLSKSKWDLMEAVIDYECAGYTKADKPLNAYDTVLKHNVKNADKLIAIMKQWDIAYSYRNCPDNPDWLEYAKTILEPSDGDYLTEIYQYVSERPEDAKIVLQYAKCVVMNRN